MTQKLDKFAEQYVAALRSHLRIESQPESQLALKLGAEAVVLGLETLELARIHEQAVALLGPVSHKKGMLRRTKSFFAEALTPIVETHRAARDSATQLNVLNQTLTLRTEELATANRQLQRGIDQRKNVETALKNSGNHYSKLLKESLQLQEGLRQLTHQVLAAQEDERKKMSRELQNEVAQTLLGINVRLHSLKQEARHNTKGLKNEIANTQRLVLKSARSMRRLAGEFGSL